MPQDRYWTQEEGIQVQLRSCTGITKRPSCSPLSSLLCCSIIQRRRRWQNPSSHRPQKEEVKAEWDMVHSIAIDFERKLDSSSKKIESLESKSRSLSDPLKEKKFNSRTAMEQLLLVTTTQTNEWSPHFRIDLTSWRAITTTLSINFCATARVRDTTIKLPLIE